MSVAWVAVGTAAVGTLVGADAARKAGNANNRAIAAQETAAQQQAKLAQEQWDFQKTTYLPKAMEQADQQLALSKKVADQQMSDSTYYRDLAGQNFDQAKKSWKYQDQMMGLADDYSSGEIGNTMAAEANADVQQQFAGAEGDMMRTASRYGINPGSGGFASGLSDLYQQKALAGAGAQTLARRAARDKAEGMVAMAAGAGQAGFGTGLSAGGLSGSSLSGAAGTSASGLQGLNSVSNTFGQGMYGAGAGLSNSASSWNMAARNAQNSPWADFAGGLTNSAMRIGGQNGWFNPSRAAGGASFGAGLDSFFGGTGTSGD